jgi:hypothetical protein
LFAIATRSFFLLGWRAVPFEIQDEALLVWALKDFFTGNWDAIPYPVTRFVASFSLLPVFGAYFGYLRLTGAISGMADVLQSYLLDGGHAYTSISIWVLAPRIISWCSLVASVPLQFVLLRRAVGDRMIAVFASILLNFSFMHLYSSFFGLPDGLGFLMFLLSLLALVAHARERCMGSTVVLSVLSGLMFLTRLQNAVALFVVGILYLMWVRRKQQSTAWPEVGKELALLAVGAALSVVVLNPLFYLAPQVVGREFSYAVAEWAPRAEWNPAIHVAHVTRVLLDEVLGFEMGVVAFPVGAALIVRGAVNNWPYRVLFAPLLFIVASMAYVSEISYETAMLILLIPATTLTAWFIAQLPKWMPHAVCQSAQLAAIGIPVLALSLVLVNPIQDWLALYKVATREGTRASARHWIHANIPAGARVYIAPYTYTVPLIESLEQLRLTAPADSELARWRQESGVGRGLSPTYHLIADLESAAEQEILPDYYVRASYAHVPEPCAWDGLWGEMLCPYGPLRGSFPHFSHVYQLPPAPPNAVIVPLSEFNPICPTELGKTVYINYRTNVLRNNVRFLCRFGPVIEIYRLLMQ